MRTEFTADRLADPRVREMDAILRKCVHCGFCNSACPTFALTGDELDGPRGRIYLLKDLLERESRPAAGVVRHIDRCLSCLACMSVCPSGVDYMHLIDYGRAHIEARARRPFADSLARACLAALLPFPRRLRFAVRLGRAVQALAARLPGRPGAWLRSLPRPQALSSFRPSQPAGGARGRNRVAFLPGCVQQVFGEDINAATLRLLDRAGCEVVRLEQTPCCGAIEHHLGREGAALRRARGNARDWARQLAASEFSAIIVNASGCGTMLKEYAHLLRADPGAAQGAAAVSASVMDLSEFLQRSALAGSAERNPGRFTLAYQNPCSMQHGQRLRAVPPALLRSAGFKVIEAGDAHACCGSAGVYSLLQPDFAERLGQAKAARLRATGAHAVASGNLGCILQLRRYLDVPVLHTAQWLDWATGGPPAPGLAAIAGTD